MSIVGSRRRKTNGKFWPVADGMPRIERARRGALETFRQAHDPLGVEALVARRDHEIVAQDIVDVVRAQRAGVA